jgi:1-acyl-sn-glycerol-3-phosphate acyltransferase
MDIFKSVIVWIIGICYTAILFPATFVIWLLALPFDRNRTLIHWLLSYQSLVLSMLIPIWKLKIEGREKIIKGTTYVIISNHQSLIDTLMINCIRYRFKWISKIENLKLPVLGWYIRMAGYLTVNRGNEESKVEMLEKALDFLKQGISIMIFPEGTRSTDKQVGFFKRGAFQLAITARVSILPVLIDGTGDILPKHGLIFSSNNKITVRVLDPVSPESFDSVSAEDLALRFNSLLKSELNILRDQNHS